MKMGDNGEPSYNVFTVRKNHRAYHQLIESRSEVSSDKPMSQLSKWCTLNSVCTDYKTIQQDLQYISDLEKALRESGIEIPIKRKNDSRIGVPISRSAGDFKIGILSDGGHDRVKEMLLKVEQFHRKFEVQISFKVIFSEDIKIRILLI